MSRIGRMPVAIPAGVTVEVKDGKMTVKGPKGTLVQEIDARISVAVENGEFHTGLCSVAAPIRNATGTVCYSVAVVSMFHRIGSEHFERAKKLTIQMAEAISWELGYNPQ